jgi:hypothetical protein
MEVIDMNDLIIAPCGIICDLCLGFQREKNKCVGCIEKGNKPNHCSVCKIKNCPEKNGNEELLCNTCNKFPCKRIKDLDKRYRTKYGENPIENLQDISKGGMENFIEVSVEKWKCKKCGKLLCVHREFCILCKEKNQYYKL